MFLFTDVTLSIYVTTCRKILSVSAKLYPSWILFCIIKIYIVSICDHEITAMKFEN